MAMIFQLPKPVAFDANGINIPGAQLRFFDATTTTPKTVWTDSGLTIAHAVPVVADSAGRFAPIYLTPGAYKVSLYDASAVLIYTVDNLDTGLAAGTGVLPIASGGTAASTAAGARTALGAASQTDLDALSASLGDLATLDTVSRGQLAANFGTILLQRSVVSSTTSLVTCAGVTPDDDTIPQVGEGTQVLSGNFTPISASSTLLVAVQIRGGSSAAVAATAALFTGASSSAIAASSFLGAANARSSLDFDHSMASPGTNAIAFSVRVGVASGTFYVNGVGTGTRILGGVEAARLLVSEYLAF